MVWGVRKTYSEAKRILDDHKEQLGTRQKGSWIEEIDTNRGFKIPSSTRSRDMF